MAKKQKSEDDDSLSYLGQKIDPEVQKKVDQYMELEEDSPAAADIDVDASTDIGDPGEVIEETGDAANNTAPLLPTEELPEAVKTPTKKASKITVLHHDEVEEPLPEAAQEEAVDVKEETSETEIAGPPVLKIDVSHDDEQDTVAEEDLTTGISDDELTEAFSEVDEDKEGQDLEVSAVGADDASAQDAENAETSPSDATPETDEDEDEDRIQLDVSEIEELSDDVEEEQISDSEIDNPEVADQEKSVHDPEDLAAPVFADSVSYKNETIESIHNIPMDDAVTSQAIADIIASDSDELLGVEDKKRKAAEKVVVAAPKPKKKKRENIFRLWFKKPLYRNATIAVVLLGLGAVAALPTSRYFVLNTAGVKVSASMKVLDDKTSLPLKNVELTIDGKTSKTDGEGNVRLEGISLGPQTVIIKKTAFADLNKTVTLGWGSNPLGEYRLTPTGVQYSFLMNDFISEKPISGGEVVYGDFSAKISEKGEAILTLSKIEDTDIEVTINGAGYRSEKIKISTANKDQTKLKVVPAKKHVFVSKQSGKFDLYQVDADGKNEEILVAGSGVEKQESLAIAPHPTKNIIAYTASRENTRNKDGFILNTLYMVDAETKEVKKVTQSERIQVVDWIGDRFVYVKIAEGASEASPNRHRIISYNIENGEEKELANTNYFNDVISVNGAIYYSPALYNVNGSVGLYKINPDGTNKKTVFQKEVWNLFRTSYDKLSMSVGQDWYELSLSNDVMVKVGGAPSVLKSRVYVPNKQENQSVWIDERDGKTVMVNYAHGTKAEKVLLTQSGIKNPVRWLTDDHIIYRVSDGQETADYIFSIRGGEPKKIRDVTNTAGIDRWYYF